MNFEFHSRQDAIMRINDSVCRFNGEPIYVQFHSRPERQTDVTAYNLKSNGLGTATLSYTDPLFDYSSPPLGYCNYKREAIFLTRIPSRTQKQGIGRDNVSTGRASTALPGHFWHDKALYNCIMGIHPSYHDALKSVMDNTCRGVAFHRLMAINKIDQKTIGLFFRERLIGFIQKSGKLKLFDLPDRPIINKILTKIEGIEYADDSSNPQQTPTG